MPAIAMMFASSLQLHVVNPLGAFLLFVLWIVLFRCSHLLVMLMRREPIIGWAIGPLGISFMMSHEPSVLFTWLNAIVPAIVSGGILYVGFFSPLSPFIVPHHPLFQVLAVVCGILVSSTGDLVTALRDSVYPLWGEARILRNIQVLRATWARIHFTPYGNSYVNDHFDSTPSDLLKAF
ncbi:hypothetical protein [Ktedonospora formicarum]|uniref:Uncharacterized protein n=1 Tax=Ktedonospora formicarum TaxID=2778364 RepID=A0A8J3HWJ7_9CHLR|nr:hypothetical protein [Ktedonospora formicarum]GHO45407.1 hypothetical protein KSX_35700 [Ktedonospora formicarum]